MALIYRSGPAVEPVTLQEAKAHLRLETDADDALVLTLIMTSRLHIEAALGLALVTQSWTYIRDRWPPGALALPLRPVQVVEAVRLIAADGTPHVLDPATYILDGQGLPPRLMPLTGAWPIPGRSVQGIEIDVVAGFGAAADDVPAPIRQAVLMLVAHWYETREVVEIGSAATAIPAAVSNILSPYRVERL